MSVQILALGLDTGKTVALGAAVPKADSVHTLLVQALQSDDKSLLEQCLGVTNQRVIDATVAKLPPAAVSSLLTKVTACARTYTSSSIGVSTTSHIRAPLSHLLDSLLFDC